MYRAYMIQPTADFSGEKEEFSSSFSRRVDDPFPFSPLCPDLRDDPLKAKLLGDSDLHPHVSGAYEPQQTSGAV